jgi:ankyrin repeat protein
LLEKGADVNGCTIKGANVVRRIIQYKNIKMVTLLLDHGADINVKDSSGGVTPFIRAVFDDNMEMAKLLLERGADPNIRSNDDKSPLFWCKSRTMAEFLLSLVIYLQNVPILNHSGSGMEL